MTQEHDPIDEYVRRVAPLDEEALARLTAPPAKRELLNRILSQPVPAGHAGRVAPPAAGTRRRRLAIAGAAAGLLLAAGSGTVAALHGSGAADRDRPPAGTAPSGPLGDGSVALDAPTSCAFPYDPDTLAERAGFAFDGSVTGIAETAPGGAQVTFRVEEWFRGGEGDEFTIEMFAPGVVSIWGDNPSYQLGSRLLVSGDDRGGRERLVDPVVWYCGFTRTYGASTAAQWREALGCR